MIFIFFVGTFLLRALGCVINDIVDRHIDPLVERTRMRPLASKRVSATHAKLFAGILAACALLLVCFFESF